METMQLYKDLDLLLSFSHLSLVIRSLNNDQELKLFKHN